jgi:hypothetical protein
VKFRMSPEEVLEQADKRSIRFACNLAGRILSSQQRMVIALKWTSYAGSLRS